jgi:hypothetical protein
MSKKLIAVASAAALALTALVSAPAHAVGFTVNIDSTSSVASHTSSTSPGAVAPANAMTSGVVEYSSTATRNVVRFEVVTGGTGGTVNVTAAGGVKLIDSLVDADSKALKIGAGVPALVKVTATGSLTYTFYAYTNSTTAGSVVIESASQKSTYFVKGVAGPAYNLVDVKFPASLTQGTTASTTTDIVSYKVTDVFGNALSTGVTATIAAFTGMTAASAVYSDTKKVWEIKIHSVTVDNVPLALNLTADDLSANGFAKPVKAAYKSISAGDLAAQVTSLTAQVAALTADYNALAARWNKRVADKKAPKKKVATK